MKRLSSFVLPAIIVCVFSVYADASEMVSRRQIDTLVARCIRPYQIFSDYFMFQSMDLDGRKEDKLAIEYLVFKSVSDALYKEMKELPVEDVNSMVRFSGTNVFNRLVSVDFWRKYQRLVKEAELDDKFDYTIRDEQYAGLVDRMAKDYGYLVSRADALAKGAIRPHTIISTGDGWVKPLPQNVREKLPDLLVKNLMWYFTYDEFVSSGVEYGTFLTTLAEMFTDTYDIVHDPKVSERIDSLLNSPEGVEDIASYMKLAHADMASLARKYGQLVNNVVYRKGTYTGHVYDGLPEGPGAWTDRKGVTYCGDFHNGLRHGRIEMTRKGQEPVVQCWYKGKLQKSVPSSINADGSFPPVASVKGRKFGCGYVYDSRTRLTQEGFFVDDELYGSGCVYSPESTVSGVFRGDVVSNCKILWPETKWKTYTFVGEKNGNLLSGGISRISRDGVRIESCLGTFVDRQQEGPGLFQIVNKNDTIVYHGQYAYGRMYGAAVITRLWGRTKTAEHQKAVYEGNVFRYKPHGKGTVDIEIRGIADGLFHVSQYGVVLREHVGQSNATVHMEGYFIGGNLVEGKVTVSNGSYMVGRFADGKLAEGRMLKKYKDGSIYDGECRDGKYHGYGSLTYADGSVYEGLFKNGYSVEKTPVYNLDPEEQKKLREAMEARRQGNNVEKVFRFEDLPVEKGVARLVNVAGVKILVRGVSTLEVTCKGSFDGEVLTNGKVTMSDGNLLEGTFEDGVLIQGKGQTVDKYMTVYVGEIKNGYPHGKGKCTYNNGTWFEGNFANGNRMDGTHYSADGKVIKVYE